MSLSERDHRIDAIRRFNRFYTKRIGVLREGLLDSGFSLAEARLLYEIAHHQCPTAAHLGKELDLDAGYLSRMLRGFEKRGLLRRTPSESDRRQYLLSLTAAGREAFAPLENLARDEVGAMIRPLSEAQQTRLLSAMQTIESLLAPGSPRRPERLFLLRPHRIGDMGWVIGRHAALYAEEYGWNEEFEAFVAELAAKFIRGFDSQRERCWIAEMEGDILGSVFIGKRSRTTAQLRMFIVEPRARGFGIGTKLLDECILFARQTGYRKIVLWTNAGLDAARRLYEAVGFKLMHEAPHRSFGHDLTGQTWALDLRPKLPQKENRRR